ncbi:MAG: NUDIX domain-containing protein [Aquirhabdus sp.]
MTVDMAIFSILQGRLQVLLIRRANFPSKGEWALPGGFINLATDQNLSATAHRKLFEKTGISSPYLEQVATVGNATRDPRGWSVTALYFALIDFNAFNEQQSSLLEQCKWVDVNTAKSMSLAFDHHGLLESAIERLINKTRYTALPVSLLPELFTLTELQHNYEIILEQSLDKKAFRRRMIEAGAVLETGQSKIVGKRPAQLYRFNQDSFDFTFPRSLELPRAQP